MNKQKKIFVIVLSAVVMLAVFVICVFSNHKDATPPTPDVTNSFETIFVPRPDEPKETDMVTTETDTTISEVDTTVKTDVAETITSETEAATTPETTVETVAADVTTAEVETTQATVVTTKAPEETKTPETTKAPETTAVQKPVQTEAPATNKEADEAIKNNSETLPDEVKDKLEARKTCKYCGYPVKECGRSIVSRDCPKCGEWVEKKTCHHCGE